MNITITITVKNVYLLTKSYLMKFTKTDKAEQKKIN